MFLLLLSIGPRQLSLAKASDSVEDEIKNQEAVQVEPGKEPGDVSFIDVKNILFLFDDLNFTNMSRTVWHDEKLQKEHAVVDRIVSAMPKQTCFGLRMLGRSSPDSMILPVATHKQSAIDHLLNRLEPKITRASDASGAALLLPLVQNCASIDLSKMPGRSMIILITDAHLNLSRREYFLRLPKVDPKIQVVPVIIGREFSEVPGYLNALACSTNSRVYDEKSIDDLVAAAKLTSASSH